MKRSVIGFLIILMVGATVLIALLASLQRMYEEVAPMDVSSGFKIAYSVVGITAVLETAGITLYFLAVILLKLQKEMVSSTSYASRGAYHSTPRSKAPEVPRGTL